MPILRTTYNSYIPELQKAYARVKRDKQIIKIINSMITKKNLSPSTERKLTALLENACLDS